MSINFGIRIFERIIIAFIILLVILEQNYCKNSFVKLSSFKQLSKLGVISYGLYCLHKIAILVVITITKKYSFNTELWQTMLLETTLALFLTIAMSILSYRFYESPFLKLKNKFSYFTK